MRLFIGLGLSNNVRNALHAAVSKLGIQGRLTLQENYHLTLAFLGERSGLSAEIEQAIASTAKNCDPFQLELSSFGYFGRRDSALLYAGLEHSRPLAVLADTVRDLLKAAGEPFDGKPFTAHVTLARRADLTTADLHTSAVSAAFSAERLTLYHSTREQGILRYRPIYEAKLGKDDAQA